MIVTLSVLSFACKVALPTVPDVTVKVATPLAFVVVGEPEMVAVPEVTESFTVFPETGPSFISSRVTVIVEAVTVSAGTEVGAAVTVD